MSDLEKIEEIYDAALKVPPMKRAAFLENICGEDKVTLKEVISLLEFDEQAADFIEKPPEDVAADVVASRSHHEDLIGKKLNHYRIVSLLGVGGMGEVYLAEDTKLGRKIAIKLMPARFAENAERKQRFEQEARAVSALNHPNIITIYGIEESENVGFIATEFIDGGTLRERIKEGALKPQETIAIAIQIASALEAAHAVGIIHRDIKPANIMLRTDGYVKVLDFGLAKLMMVSSDSADSVTREQTAQNQIMGTIFYMSPEQALGERVDARTDIFSLGVVLYEMLSGVQPFKGPSDAAVYNATINKTPPRLTDIDPQIPIELSLIVEKAIEKESKDRYQTAAEMRQDLQQLKENSASFNSGPSYSQGRNARRAGIGRFLLPLTAALAAILVSILGWSWYSARDAKTPDSLKNLKFTQLTSQSGQELFPNLSPDGRSLIYSSRQGENWHIYLLRVGGSNAVDLTPDSKFDNKQAAFSPTGDEIAFRSERGGGGIMGATGESVRRVSETGFYPAWSPDGKKLVIASSDFERPNQRDSDSVLFSIELATGAKTQLTTTDAIQPSWSPHGGRIAYWAWDSEGSRNIRTVSATGGEPVIVTNDTPLDWNPTWSPDGKYLYFLSNRGGPMGLWRVTIDETTGVTSGEPEVITTPSQYVQHISFSRDGRQFVFGQAMQTTNIERVSFNSQSETLDPRPTEITRGAKIFLNASPSPDGEWIASDGTKDGQEDLFVMRSDGSDIRQLTHDKFQDRGPMWSPDGKKLIFYSNRSGQNQVWRIDADGANLEQVTDSEQASMFTFYSPDGKQLVSRTFKDGVFIMDSRMPLRDQTPMFLPKRMESGEWLMAYSWSPDQSKIGLFWFGNDHPRGGIYTYDLATQKYDDLADFGESPVFLSDDRRIIFFQNDTIFLIDMKTRKTKQLLSVAPDTLQSIRLSADNRYLYYDLEKRESDIYLAAPAGDQ